MYSQAFQDRFWAKVQKGEPDACWHWTASSYARTRYGQIMGPDRVPLRAHRVAYELGNGPIPKGGSVLHRCGEASCCNPAHLYLGTAAENSRDRSRHGRGAKKLTERQVEIVRVEWAVVSKDGKAPYGWISRKARELGVKPSTVQDIVDGLSWRHLTPDSPPPQVTREGVVAIRRDFADGASTKVLAEAYAVTPQCIRDIVARRTWAKVP